MSSKRIFELVNIINVSLSDNSKPFDGKQLIIVGEFLQLRPVPNYHDEGYLMYQSDVFKSIITHRFELTIIQRQDGTELDFLNCLRELRIGSCSHGTKSFIRELARPLRPEKQNEALHIFFKKLPVLLHNHNVLLSLPGDSFLLEATDTNIGKHFKCPTEKTLHLKPGWRVMLLWNKTQSLRNGSTGRVMSLNEDGNVIVDFPASGPVEIRRETWFRVSPSGDIIGSRTQFPLTLCYAITCHKSQGLTLPDAIVHCTKEFVPGLIYVAVTRVKTKDNLQILNFQTSQLLQPSSESVNICHISIPMREDFTCCRRKMLCQDNMVMVDRVTQDEDGTEDDEDNLGLKETCDTFIDDYFERGEPEEQNIDL
ncbi:hypothetical protein QZH41_002046 [Actinostola sp. cb2023]|nr:hypothetical protein QZH41_002046 [Actinostola sp. cb2023]